MIRSALGPQLHRAYNLAHDSTGRLHPRRKAGVYEIKCRETRSGVNTIEEQQIRDLVRSRWCSLMTRDELEVMHLQGKITRHAKVRRPVLAGDLHRAFDESCELVPGSQKTVEQKSGVVAEYVDVDGEEPVQLHRDQIAERLGITANQVHELIKSAHRKFKRACKL